MKRKIEVFHSHIEVYPYEEGENRMIEEMYSVWDPTYYHFIRIGYYVKDHILYLPRGTNLNILERSFGTDAQLIKNPDPVEYIKINPLLEPRNRIQEDGVKFLCSEDKFSKGANYGQLSLNLDTGDGKTIALILSIAKHYKCKSIIIVHQTKLKAQWKNEFLKASDIDENEIVDITGSNSMMNIIDGKTEGSIYLVNHQTIHSFANLYGWDKVKEFFNTIKVGVKVYDEAHKYFTNILMIDFFSNTQKTIYLTATFTRNQMKEKIMFKTAFSNCYRFGEETLSYEEKRKHIQYFYVTFSSDIEPVVLSALYNKFGVSSYKYIDYAIKGDENQTLLKVMAVMLRKVENLRGKILVISPKIDSTELVAEYIKKLYPNRSIGVINSERTEDENREAAFSDIISSTSKSLGTGIDIRGLRVIINMEPFTSESNMIQLSGRLREFTPTDDTFFFDIVDISLSDLNKQGLKRKKVMKKKAKEIKEVKF